MIPLVPAGVKIQTHYSGSRINYSSLWRSSTGWNELESSVCFSSSGHPVLRPVTKRSKTEIDRMISKNNRYQSIGNWTGRNWDLFLRPFLLYGDLSQKQSEVDEHRCSVRSVERTVVLGFHVSVPVSERCLSQLVDRRQRRFIARGYSSFFGDPYRRFDFLAA